MKPTAGPKTAVRPSGGLRSGFGHFNEEHLEQQAAGSAVQQKQLAQQTTQSSQSQTGGSALQSGKPQHTPTQQDQAEPPRALSTTTEELVKRPVRDVLKGLKTLFDLNSLLGVKPGDTPEEQAHKRQLHQRWQQLTEEQQTVAKQRFEQEMKKKQAVEEEEQQKQAAKQEEEQQGFSAVAPPTSPKKGPIGLAGMSKKQKATTQLQQQRQSIGRVAGAN